MLLRPCKEAWRDRTEACGPTAELVPSLASDMSRMIFWLQQRRSIQRNLPQQRVRFETQQIMC